jgi:hypothetical protein
MTTSCRFSLDIGMRSRESRDLMVQEVLQALDRCDLASRAAAGQGRASNTVGIALS